MRHRSFMLYEVRPIASAACDALASHVILATNSLAHARRAAARAAFPFGAGIESTRTGKIDVGFGFGEPCPPICAGAPGFNQDGDDS